MKIVEFEIKFLQIYFPNGPVNERPALVKVMAWGRPGEKKNSIWAIRKSRDNVMTVQST